MISPMSDPLTISLTGPFADEVRAAAEARGIAPEEYVRQRLASHDPYDDLSWEEDMRRLEEPGENIPLDEAMDRLRAKVVERRAAK